MLRAGHRKGDGGDVAYIEFVDRQGEIRPAKPAAPNQKQAPKLPTERVFVSSQAERDEAERLRLAADPAEQKRIRVAEAKAKKELKRRPKRTKKK